MFSSKLEERENTTYQKRYIENPPEKSVPRTMLKFAGRRLTNFKRGQDNWIHSALLESRFQQPGCQSQQLRSRVEDCVYRVLANRLKRSADHTLWEAMRRTAIPSLFVFNVNKVIASVEEMHWSADTDPTMLSGLLLHMPAALTSWKQTCPTFC